MKKNKDKKIGLNMKILVVIAFVGLLPLSWYRMFSDSEAKETQYKEYLQVAREKSAMGITKVAKEYYDQAFTLNKSYEIQCEVARMYLDNGEIDKYVGYCLDLVGGYPKEVLAYEYLAEHYYITEQYAEIFKMQDALKKRKGVSEKINTYCDELQYEYTETTTDFTEVLGASSGYIGVHDEKKGWGFTDLSGKLMGYGYAAISPYNAAGYAGVTDKEGRSYIVDSSNEKIYVDPEKRNITFIGYITNTNFPIVMDGKYYTCDLKFNISEKSYDYISSFNYSKAAARQGDTWFFIDTSGERISDKTYEDIKVDDCGLIYMAERNFVKKDGYYQLIDINETVVSEQKYEDAWAFVGTEPTAVKMDGKWGYIDATGTVVIQPQYHQARPFSNGFAGVYDLMEWKYINEKNEVVIAGQFDEIREFTSKKTAFVKYGAKWKVIILTKYNY